MHNQMAFTWKVLYKGFATNNRVRTILTSKISLTWQKYKVTSLEWAQLKVSLPFFFYNNIKVTSSRLVSPWTGFLGQRNTLRTEHTSRSPCVIPFLWLLGRHLAPRIMCRLCATSSWIKYDETLCIVLWVRIKITVKSVKIWKLNSPL